MSEKKDTHNNREKEGKTETSILISETQRKRASNQIWNAAEAYDFSPILRAYDSSGNAELYWNSIIGTAQKYYGHELDPMWEMINRSTAVQICEQLAWIGIENACFQREALVRPVFPVLRKAYAQRMLTSHSSDLPEPFDQVCRLHFERILREHHVDEYSGFRKTENGDSVLNQNHDSKKNGPEQNIPKKNVPEKNVQKKNIPKLSHESSPSDILDRLECRGNLTGEELREQIVTVLDELTLLIPDLQEKTNSGKFIHLKNFFHIKNKKNRESIPKIRSFSGGLGEHGDPLPADYIYNGKHQIFDMSEKKSDAAIAGFVRNIFGTALADETELKLLERSLCSGDHDGCHLYLAKGDALLKPGIEGYASNLRRQAVKQMQHNLEYFELHRQETATAILKLTERWRSALLICRQDQTVHSSYGKLAAGRIWRMEKVYDDRIFNREIRGDDSDISVDLLLDASMSQEERQKHIALQAYIIAESLTRCGIRVRVSSFCSMSGYTILTRYRDYEETEKNLEIFHYTTFGCNRDGLAVRLTGFLMDQMTEQAEQRILLLLSDTRPNDIIRMIRVDGSIPYTQSHAVENTAKEIRYLRHRGIHVLCVFTGTDDDLPAAHTIYGKDFVRIRNLDHFAKAVGDLMLTQIAEM